MEISLNKNIIETFGTWEISRMLLFFRSQTTGNLVVVLDVFGQRMRGHIEHISSRFCQIRGWHRFGIPPCQNTMKLHLQNPALWHEILTSIPTPGILSLSGF